MTLHSSSSVRLRCLNLIDKGFYSCCKMVSLFTLPLNFKTVDWGIIVNYIAVEKPISLS